MNLFYDTRKDSEDDNVDILTIFTSGGAGIVELKFDKSSNGISLTADDFTFQNPSAFSVLAHLSSIGFVGILNDVAGGGATMEMIEMRLWQIGVEKLPF